MNQSNKKINRIQGMYIKGTWGSFRFEAKVCNNASEQGINGGRVLKLKIWKGQDAGDGQELVSYDGTWLIKPQTDLQQYAFENLLGELEALPPFEFEQ